MMSKSALVATGISHSFGSRQVLRSVDLTVEPGELLTLLGPSGSGKTTLLSAMAGMVVPDQGTISVDDRDVTHLPPEKRDMGFVFQHYALFPHMTIRDNVAFPLRMRKTPGKEVRSRVDEALDLVGLLDRDAYYPGQLSGGQQQRVALARAIVFRPRVLLLDEPLGALDRRMRQELGFELRKLQRTLGITTVYVTHDQEEAFILSNRVAVMEEGVITQVAEPRDLYLEPNTLFNASFVGDINVLRGTVVERSADGSAAVDVDGHIVRGQAVGAEVVPGQSACWTLRPERLSFSEETTTSTARMALPGTLVSSVFGGSWLRHEIVLWNGESALIRQEASPANTGSLNGSDPSSNGRTLSYAVADARVFAQSGASGAE